MTNTGSINQGKVSRLREIVGLSGNESINPYQTARKIVYHKDNFSAFLEGRYFDLIPVSVEVVPSLDCCFNCENCSYAQNGAKDRREGERYPRYMGFGVLNLVLNGLKKLGTKSVIFTGGGEPLMNPDVFNHIRAAKNKGFEVGLFTNGYVFSESRIENCLDAAPNFIRVSLNAGSAETHRIMAGYSSGMNGVFDRVVNNIIEFGKAKKRRGEGPGLSVGFIMSKDNSSDEDLDSIKDTLLNIYDLSIGSVKSAAFRPKVLYFDKQKNVVREQPDRELFRNLSDRLEEKVASPLRCLGINVIINREGFDALASDYVDVPNIASPWSASFNFNGVFHIGSEFNGMYGFEMGDIRTTAVEDIWMGDKRRDIVKRMESGEIKTLHHYKLRGINDLLLKVKQLGTFTKEEVDAFYQGVDMSKAPSHVNFV